MALHGLLLTIFLGCHFDSHALRIAKIAKIANPLVNPGLPSRILVLGCEIGEPESGGFEPPSPLKNMTDESSVGENLFPI